MKRKNLIRFAFYLLVIVIIGLFIIVVFKQEYSISDVRQLPVIEALTIHGDKFVSSDYLDSSKRTALLFFHPECEYCQKELEGILAQHMACNNVQWLFLTLASEDVLGGFLRDYPLEAIPDAYVIRENWPDTYVQFGVKSPPELFIYNESRKLIKRHKGFTSIKTIVQELQ